MLDYYFYINTSNYIYSLDMVRLNFELNEDIIDINDKFFDILNKFSNAMFCKLNRYIKNGFGYRYLYQLIIDSTDEKCSFSIGLQLGSLSANKNKGFIEFNPNKCLNSSIFKNFYNDFISLCYSFKLIRYDIAIDIPVKRDFIKMLRSGKFNYRYEYHDDNNGLYLNRSITEYQGQRNHNKFTKLYDKSAESHLNYDLTRIEFTFDRDETEFKNIPKFILLSYDQFQLSSSNLVLLELLINSEDFNYYYNLLSYRKRKSLEPFLTDHYLNIDYSSMLCIRNFALSLEDIKTHYV